ncbi:unnamed protein product [Penicillium pancosmium]
MPHSPETFLRLVINSTTGKEQTFNTHASEPQDGPEDSTIRNPGDDRLYPPLFHAATDVRAFVKALSSIPNLRHLRINCEGQPPSHRYRRSIVD